MRPARWLLAALLVVAGLATGAGAQAAPQLDLRIERDTRPRTLGVGTLSVSYTITVTDRATGQAPQGTYVLYAQATNTQGEKTQFFACGHTNDVDSRTPPGVYDCTVIVDHGGAWDFVAVVSERESEFPVPVAEASVPFELAGDNQIVAPEAGIEGNVVEVALLVGHGAVAAGWFACVALLSVLALPGARGGLSTAGRHRLEGRLGPIVKGTWVTTALVVGSGVFLLLNQTAYDTPWSSSEIDAVFDLPYGKPYFLTLAVKVALYGLMVAATVPLVRGAQRRMVSDDVRGRPRLGVAVLGGGAVGVALCVTLLKYFHELVEAARGVL